jgi:hypothetical protein
MQVLHLALVVNLMGAYGRCLTLVEMQTTRDDSNDSLIQER